MADEKTIVTKKTAPKAATPTKKAATKTTTVPKKVAAKPSVPAKSPTATKTSPARKAPAVPSKAAPLKSRTATGIAGAAKATSRTTKQATPAAKPRKTATASEPVTQAQTITLRSLSNVSAEERLHMVHEAAYYRAEKRGFTPGHEVEDWAAAEREIDDLLERAKRLFGG